MEGRPVGEPSLGESVEGSRSMSKDTVKSPPSLALRGSGRETLLVVLGQHEADVEHRCSGAPTNLIRGFACCWPEPHLVSTNRHRVLGKHERWRDARTRLPEGPGVMT